MKNKTKPIDFTPQQINLAKELVKKWGDGDLNANVEFNKRFNEEQRLDLFTNHIKIPKSSLKEFEKSLKAILREEDQKLS